jgi:glutamyl-tRNA synthetase
MTNAVRVRYAPSPTGIPHVGNIRTALFNWLFARHHGGSFIVRIEDTDQARKVDGATRAILESLHWLGIDWDEGPDWKPGMQGDDFPSKGTYGPYFQSQRRSLYHEWAQKLIAGGHAYVCTCTSDRLDALRKLQQEKGIPPMYDRHCRAKNLPPEGPHVIRFKIPIGGATAFHDVIRGEIKYKNETLDDFVLLKSDGFPTYHLANVVDDHFMAVTHVLRADEWLPSTPRHKLLYEAFGWTPPVFAHMPLILGPDRSKLSKRHGATSLLEYRDQGYLPEAMMNFLALLGWSLDDKTEILSRDELVKHFDVARVGATGAIFNQEKLSWMNGLYIRERIAEDDLAARVLPLLETSLPPDAPRPLDRAYVRKIVPLVKERMKRLTEITEFTDFFFVSKLAYVEKDLVPKGMDKASAARALEAVLAQVQPLPQFDAPSLEAVLRPLAETLGLKTGQLFGAVRTAVTGKTVTPPLFETMAVLGRERSLERLRGALAFLQG